MNDKKSETISEELVLHIAHLARLAIAPDEVREFTHQLAGIIEYVNMLSKAEVKEATPAYDPGQCIFRDDEILPSMPIAEILMNAPVVEGNFFKMPKILGGEE